jgi:hypothetical protein
MGCLETSAGKAAIVRGGAVAAAWEVALPIPWTVDQVEDWWREHLAELAGRLAVSDSSNALSIAPAQS